MCSHQIEASMKKTPLVTLLCLSCLGHADIESRRLDMVFAKAERALGWDATDLKAVEKDLAERPTLERDSNALNDVERKISYRPNGKKQSQSFTVVSRIDGKVLYDKKEWWNASGDLEHSYVQNNAYSKEGNRIKGATREIN